MQQTLEPNKILITKRKLLSEVYHQLNGKFSLSDIKNIYETIENIVSRHLDCSDQLNDVTVKLSNGFTISSSIKPKRSYSVNGENITMPSRKWFHAKISRYHNRRIVNEFNK